MASMKFTAAGFVYRMIIAPAPLVDDAGKEVWGLIDFSARQIYISEAAPRDERYRILSHELTHAWQEHMPSGHDAEGQAKFNATVSTNLLEELDANGGRDALMRMEAEDVTVVDRALDYSECQLDLDDGTGIVPRTYVQPVETLALPAGGRTQCGVCSLIVPAGAIVTGQIQWSGKHGGRVVERTAFCAHCDHLFSWVEGCDLNGRPNGAIPEGPVYRRGKPAEEFLAAHPEAATIVVS